MDFYCVILWLLILSLVMVKCIPWDSLSSKEKKRLGSLTSIGYWAKYRLNLKAITTIFLIGSVICVAVMGLLLYCKEFVSPTTQSHWGEILIAAWRDGYFGEAVMYGIELVFDVLGGEGRSLRAGFPNHSYFTFSLCLLVPASTVAALVSFAMDFFPKPLPTKQEYLIFSQVNDRGIRLAESLCKHGTRRQYCPIYLRAEKGNISADNLKRLDVLHARIYPYTEPDLLRIHFALKKKKLRFFFLDADTDQNFSQIIALLKSAEQDSLFCMPLFLKNKKLREEEHCGIFRQELYLLSETASAPLLIDYLRDYLCKEKRSQRKNVFLHTELRLLDRYRTITYHLLQEKPLFETADNHQIRVLILGFGRVGQAFFRAAQSFCVMAGYQTSFMICDQEMNRQWEAFQLGFPECGTEIVLDRQNLNVESPSLISMLNNRVKSKIPFTYILISLGEDECNIRIANRIARQYRQWSWEDGTTHQPLICVNLENEIKSSYVSRFFLHSFTPTNNYTPPHALHVFGSDAETFSSGMLMKRGLWTAAREIHIGLKADDFVYWSEYERRSSIACAAHAQYILHTVSEMCATSSRSEAHDVTWLPLSAAQKNTLIDAEHRRWVAYVRSEGMQKIPVEIALRYQNVIGSHIDNVAQISPCLVETNDLDALYKQLYPTADSGNSFRARDRFVVEHAEKIKRRNCGGKQEMGIGSTQREI